MKKLIALIGALTLFGSCSVGASRYLPKQEVKVEPEYGFVETRDIHGIEVRYFQGRNGNMYIYKVFDREKGEFEVNFVQFNKNGDMIVNGVVMENDGSYMPRLRLNNKEVRPSKYSYPEIGGGK